MWTIAIVVLMVPGTCNVVKAGTIAIESLSVTTSPSGNWIDTTFLIRNNTNKNIKYVMVEISGWTSNNRLAISSKYMSDSIPAMDYRAVTFPVRKVGGATHWRARVIEVKYK
jgi:hypothetical protein